VFEREEDSSSNSDELSEDSDVETSDDSDGAAKDSDHGKEHSNDDAEQATHSHPLPRLKMPKTSDRRTARPFVEVLPICDSKVPEKYPEQKQLH